MTRYIAGIVGAACLAGGSAMAATSQPLATGIALDILKAGGSAVDAAIAANAALGLMEPAGCSTQVAGGAARINHIGSSQPAGSVMRDGGVLHLGSGCSDATRRALEALGHTLGEPNGSFGGYQAILRDHAEGEWHGASEVRKDAQAAGYQRVYGR